MREKYQDIADIWEEIGARLLVITESINTASTVFLITSIGPKEGKSTISRNIAHILSQAGKRTALVQIRTKNAKNEFSEEDKDMLSLDQIDQPLLVDFNADNKAFLSLTNAYSTLPRFSRQPKDWLKDFDCMLIDGNNFDHFLTRYFIPKTSGIILVINTQQQGLRSLIRAKQKVENLGGYFIGTILNQHKSPLPKFLEGIFS